jgi:hypothetical protein
MNTQEKLQQTTELYIGKGVASEATEYLLDQGVDVPQQIGRRLHRAQ